MSRFQITMQAFAWLWRIFLFQTLQAKLIRSRRASHASIQNEVSKLTREIGFASPGASIYLASEYEELLQLVSNITKNNQMLAKQAEKFDFQFSLTQKQLSSHEQYGRRENLE